MLDLAQSMAKEINKMYTKRCNQNILHLAKFFQGNFKQIDRNKVAGTIRLIVDQCFGPTD